MPYPFTVQPLPADDLNAALLWGRIVARGHRITSSTAAATEQSVLRIDNISVVSGVLYWIGTGPLTLDTSVANDHGRVILRYDNTGAAATTASTFLQLSQTKLVDATNGDTVTIGATYTPVANQTLSVLLTTARQAGTGNISLVSGALFPIELFVMACGVDPGDTGVDI